MQTATESQPAARIRRLAAAADADPRTVRKYLSGAKVKGMVAERIEKALAAESRPYG